MRVLGRMAALLWLGLCQCGDMPRDNPLDPKNPLSQRQRVVLAEAFVSDDPSTRYCPQALEALTRLEAEVGTARLLIVEYHLANPGKWVDAYALPEARLRYEELASAGLGVPDVFFSGAAGRVQGAHSVETAYGRYRREFDARSATAAFFTIEGEAQRRGQQVEVAVSLARLGAEPADDLLLRALVVQDTGQARHRHVVRAVLSGEHVATLRAGQVVQCAFQVPANLLGGDRTWLVVFVESRPEGTRVVEQATAVVL